MKYFLRVFVFNTFALWLVAQILPTLKLTGELQTLAIGGLVLSVLMILVKPILSLLFLPINIITFGFLSWLVNVAVIYLLTLFVPEVSISPWSFQGFSGYGFSVPPLHLSYTLSLIVSSLVVTFVVNLLHNVAES